MMRLLLTILALLTGIAAQGAQAETRMCSACGANGTEIGSVEGAREAGGLCSRMMRGVALSAPGLRLVSEPGHAMPHVAFPVPAVLPGVDRARE